MRWAVLVAVAACGDNRFTPADAPPPLDYKISVSTTMPRRADAPTVYIDGVPSLLIESTEAVHHIELRYAEHVLFAMETSSTPQDCPQATGRLVSVVVDLEEDDSGDLRLYSEAETFENGGCLGDAFALPRCGCAATERCMPRIALADPLFTHLDCAPIGPKQHGDACLLVPDPAGDYDDCGAGLFCYQGTCHLLCVPGWVGNGAAGTALPDGYPNDALLCD
jgi:hypothetical protein